VLPDAAPKAPEPEKPQLLMDGESTPDFAALSSKARNE
jgi:hypothetical protein